MKCDRCEEAIGRGDERQHLGQVLCEDCFMEVLSPAKTCDPWAVHSAKSFEKHMGSSSTLTPVQAEIVRIVEERCGIEPSVLLETLNGKLTKSDLEREFATLRHMEKLRAEKKDGKIFYRTW